MDVKTENPLKSKIKRHSLINKQVERTKELKQRERHKDYIWKEKSKSPFY